MKYTAKCEHCNSWVEISERLVYSLNSFKDVLGNMVAHIKCPKCGEGMTVSIPPDKQK
jgi:predicted RNA-binding Zn-ribbon protein involved in translation (DUF1610 family)